MIRTLLFIFGLSFILQPIMGQEINNKAYDLMLSGMLSHSIEEISVGEASKREKAVFLDSREKREFEVSHIRQANWVGYDQADLSILDELPKDTEIIVYCSVGYRSEKIGERIKEKGGRCWGRRG